MMIWNIKQTGGAMMVAALAVTMISTSAWARKGGFIGAGYAQQSISGDLDGKTGFLDSTGSVALLAGKMGAGTGLEINGGYGFEDWFTLEGLYSTTSHTASHEMVPFDSDATLTTLAVMGRLVYPATESLEVFGRLGVGSYTAKYAEFGLDGYLSGTTFVYTRKGEVTFSGSGFLYGAGLEYYVNQIGIALGYTVHQAKFNKGDGMGLSGELSPKLSATINTADVAVSYHF